MRHLKISQKLAVVCTLLGAATALALLFLVLDRNEPIAGAAKERLGLAYLGPIRELREILPDARRRQAPDGGDGERQAALDLAMARLEELDLRLGPELGTTEDFVRLKKIWRQMKSGEPGAADGNGFETGLRSLRAVVVDTSNLILDPALDSYYLMDASVVALSNETDLLNQLLDRRSARAGRPRHAELAAMLALLKSNIETIESDLRVATEFNAALKAPLEDDRNRFERSAHALLDRLDRASAAEAGDAAVDDVDVAIRAALADSFNLYDAAVARLDDLLAQRIAMTSRQRNRDVAVVVGLFLFGMAASIWIGARTIRSLHRVTAAVRQIGRGETPALLETSADDEVGMLAAAVNGIRELRLPTAHASPALDQAGATESADRTVLEHVREENLRLKLLVAEMVLAKHARADDADGEGERAIARVP